MSKLDDILHPIVVDATDYTIADKEQIKALIAEICEECDASPRYKEILEAL